MSLSSSSLSSSGGQSLAESEESSIVKGSGTSKMESKTRSCRGDALDRAKQFVMEEVESNLPL